jgi:hypothetical protein
MNDVLAHRDDEGEGGGGGEPRAALEAFANAAVKWSSAPTPDPHVSAAFSLGWHVAQALAWAQTTEAPKDELELDDVTRWAVLISKIEAAHERLAKGAQPRENEGRPSAASDSGDVRALAKEPPVAKAADVERVGSALLQELYVSDSKLGKAFQLGQGMHQMCGHGPVTDALQDRVAAVRLLLADLASTLPANAAHSVMNSLSLWEDAVFPAPPKPRRWRRHAPQAGTTSTPEHVADCFRRQGAVWYSILAGEVAAKDLLRLSDYVGSAEEVIGRLRELAVRAIRGRLLPWVLVVAALLVVGVVVLVLSTSASGVTVGATTLIAAFGLTWKGIGGVVGRAAAKGEQALWDAQLDWTIAYRCTISIDELSRPATRRVERLQAHSQTWKDWQRRWPDLDGVPPEESTASRPND